MNLKPLILKLTQQVIMKTKIQQSNEEINSIGGISLIGGLFNSLKNLKKVDLMQALKAELLELLRFQVEGEQPSGHRRSQR